MSTTGIGKVLKNANFLKLWIGQMVSDLGDEVAFFGIGVLVVFSWHGSALDLSAVMVASSLPILLFGPFAGVFVDRWNKKTTMVVADMIRAALALLFIFCTSIIHLAIVVFLISTVSRFFYPARNAIIPDIVEKDILVEANSLSQMTYMLSVIMGPAISTGMIYLLGYVWIFIFDSLTYLFSAVMLLSLAYRAKRHAGERRAAREMVEGLLYIWRNKPVRLIIFIFTVMMLFVGGLNVIYPIYVRDILHMDIAGFSAIEILFGIGTVVGSVATGIVAGRLAPGRMVLLGVLGMGTAILILGIFPLPIIALVVGGLLIGYFVGFLEAPANAILQSEVEEKYRGRVFGAQGAVIQGAALLSMASIGFLISILGIIPVILLAGLTLVALALGLLASRRVSKTLGK